MPEGCTKVPMERILTYEEIERICRVAAGLGKRAGGIDVELGCLHEDEPLGVEARAARAAGDLMELARVEPPLAMPVVLGERGHEDGVDGHVDAHAQGVGAADHR